MDTTDTKKQIKKPTPKVSTTGIRVSKEIRKDIARLLETINKKQFGKKIKVAQLIELAIKLINDDHIKELQQTSLTNADKIEMQYRDYVRQNGPISKDEYMGKLHELMLGQMSKPTAK